MKPYTFETYSGCDFTQLETPPLVRLTQATEEHNGFHFKTGLNVDTVPMTTEVCVPGGLYFTDAKDAYKWVNYASAKCHKAMRWARDVQIPDDATVVVYYDENKRRIKYKTDKLDLGPRKCIFDYFRYVAIVDTHIKRAFVKRARDKLQSKKANLNRTDSRF